MDKIKQLLENYTNYLTEMENTISSVGKKQILLDLVMDARKDQLWDLYYQLAEVGYYTEDKRRLRQFALDIIGNSYKNSPTNEYQEKENHNIENAIFNALHKDKEEYLNESVELHETLNPLLWENNELKPDVKAKLLSLKELVSLYK